MRRAPAAASREPSAAGGLGTWRGGLARLAGDAAPDARAASQRVRTFRRFLLLYTAVRSGIWLALSPVGLLPLALCAAAAGLAAALVWTRGWERRAAWLALAVVLVQVAWRFPFGANHLYLELLLLVLVSLDGGSDADARLVQASVRWLVAIVLFQTGLQKALYGHYWRGDFLAFMAAEQERFGRVFRVLLSEADLARLSSLDRLATGAGPYRVASRTFRLASVAVVLAEMGIPFLLMVHRTRRLGVAAGVALMAAIQVAALEIGFALLFVNALLLFLPPVFGRRALAASALVLAYGLGAAAGVLPGHPADWNLL